MPFIESDPTDEDVPFYRRANITQQGLSDLRARSVQASVPEGTITETTELVWVNGVCFVNEAKHKIAVERAYIDGIKTQVKAQMQGMVNHEHQ